MKDKALLLKTLIMLAGIFFIGLGTCFMRISNMGTDPYSCFNIAVSNHFDISLTMFQSVYNIVLLLIVLLGNRKYFGLGTVGNMFGLGFIIENLYPVLTHILGKDLNFFIRTGFMLSGVLITCFGVSLYIAVNLGAAPYDSLGYVIEEKTRKKITFRFARIALDIISAGVGFSFGGKVGIATLLMATCTGPIVQYFRKVLEKKVLKNLL